jgi:3-oxoacyl-(acyl-carrier-protein) synthase
LAKQLFVDAKIDPQNMTGIDRRKFGVCLGSNIEIISNTITKKDNLKFAREEFAKQNFMVPASLAMTHGLQG